MESCMGFWDRLHKQKGSAWSVVYIRALHRIYLAKGSINLKKCLKTAHDQNYINKFCRVCKEVLISQKMEGIILCHKA